jgi:Protein of unknown function (DUF3124)
MLHRILLVLILSILSITMASASEVSTKTSGETVYVPAYSHIYHGNREAPVLLSVTLSMRNTDPGAPISITTVDYYDSKGKLLKHFLSNPLVLGPLGSDRFVIAQNDESGGSGANFIVRWQADGLVNPPIIETVMIGTQSQLGISFTSRGQALQP